MIFLEKFLSAEDAASIETAIRGGGYKSAVTPFQPQPIPLPGESLGETVLKKAVSTLRNSMKKHRRLIQPDRLSAVSGPDFIRFLDGMSLGSAPVPALHGVDAVHRTGMRCDALLHVRLSRPDCFKGGDIQVSASDQAARRLALGQGDAVLLNWEDLFALRVVHQGPLFHMIVRFQYESPADSFEALTPLADAASSKDPALAGAAAGLLARITSSYRSRKASPAPPKSGDTR
ncbi:MAG: hypothetical protein RIM72_05540 [Alphaproteobacteria bacterium]